MTFRDVLETSTTILVSLGVGLGGGGTIVFKLSGYLGKIWAERGLEQQRHEYTRLNLELSHQLEIASRRIQMEIDAIGVLRKLKAESEFAVVLELWQRISPLRIALHEVKHGTLSARGDERKWWMEQQYRCEALYEDARNLLFEKMPLIPKPIAEIVQNMLGSVSIEIIALFAGYLDAPDDPAEAAGFGAMSKKDILKQFQSFLNTFEKAIGNMETAMREHIAGSTTSSGETSTRMSTASGS